MWTLSAHGVDKDVAKPWCEGARVIPTRGTKLQQAWHKSRDELAIALIRRPDHEPISNGQFLAHRPLGQPARQFCLDES